MLELALRKHFPQGQTAAFSLQVAYSCQAHRLVLFGPSGSGKSLTVQAIAGLIRPNAGRICLNGRLLYDSERGIFVPPQQRRMGYMFQDYALFPHLSLLANVAYARTGLWLISRRERLRAQELLDRFALGHLAHHAPAQLSGGQRQRAALVRALNADPELLLLDEPFSALDPLLRAQLRQELLALLDELQLPVVLITHDPEDVAIFAHSLALYDQGRAQFIAAPCCDDQGRHR